MEIKMFDDYQSSSCAIARKISEIVLVKPDALLCFAAGMTSLGVFEALIDLHKSGKCDFSRVRFSALDEWLNLEDEKENCAAFMKKNLYVPLEIRQEQIRFFDFHNPDRKEMCEEMDNYLFENGPLDFMLLGIGMNGHIGFNEPGMPWEQYSMVAELDEVTTSVGQKYFSSSMKLSAGVSLGIKHVLNTKTVILQATGVHKQGIVKKLIACRPGIDLPASALKCMDNSYLYIDESLDLQSCLYS